MALNCIIVEDQLPAQRIISRYIDDIPELKLSGNFTDPLEALAFLRQHTIELIFLDIHLPKLSGMEFMKILPYKPKIILTTAFAEFALQGYEHDVLDYLLKPISFERFLKAVSKVIYAEDLPAASPVLSATQSTDQSVNEYLFVKSDRSIIKIAYRSIRLLKAEGDYTWVFTEGKNHFLSYTLKYWLEVLPTQKFCRIHKSYIINLDFVEKIEGNQVFIANEKEAIPIGRSFREDFLRRIDLKE